jgi:hypothetical protein
MPCAENNLNYVMCANPHCNNIFGIGNKMVNKNHAADIDPCVCDLCLADARKMTREKAAQIIKSKRIAVKVLSLCYGAGGFDYSMINQIGDAVRQGLIEQGVFPPC